MSVTQPGSGTWPAWWKDELARCEAPSRPLGLEVPGRTPDPAIEALFEAFGLEEITDIDILVSTLHPGMDAQELIKAFELSIGRNGFQNSSAGLLFAQAASDVGIPPSLELPKDLLGDKFTVGSDPWKDFATRVEGLNQTLLNQWTAKAIDLLKKTEDGYLQDFREYLAAWQQYAREREAEASPLSQRYEFRLVVESDAESKKLGGLEYPHDTAVGLLEACRIDRQTALAVMDKSHSIDGIEVEVGGDVTAVSAVLSVETLRPLNKAMLLPGTTAYVFGDSALLSTSCDQPLAVLAYWMAYYLDQSGAAPGVAREVTLKAGPRGGVQIADRMDAAVKARLIAFLPAPVKPPPSAPAQKPTRQARGTSLTLPARTPPQARPQPRRASSASTKPTIPAAAPPARPVPPREAEPRRPRSTDVDVTLRHERRTKSAAVSLWELLGSHGEVPLGGSVPIECEPLHGKVRRSSGLGKLTALIDVDTSEIPGLNKERWAVLQDNEEVGFYIFHPHILLKGASPMADRLLEVIGLRAGGSLMKRTQAPSSGRGSVKRVVHLTNMKHKDYVMYFLRSMGSNRTIAAGSAPDRRSVSAPKSAGQSVRVDIGGSSLAFGARDFDSIAAALDEALKWNVGGGAGMVDEFRRRLQAEGVVALAPRAAVLLMKGAQEGGSGEEFVLSLPNAFPDQESETLYAHGSHMDYCVFDGKVQIFPGGAGERPDYAFLGRLLRSGTARKIRFGRAVKITYPTGGVVPVGDDQVVETWTAFLKGKVKIVVDAP